MVWVFGVLGLRSEISFCGTPLMPLSLWRNFNICSPQKGKSFATSVTFRSSSSSDMLLKFRVLSPREGPGPKSASFHSAINCSYDWLKAYRKSPRLWSPLPNDLPVLISECQIPVHRILCARRICNIIATANSSCPPVPCWLQIISVVLLSLWNSSVKWPKLSFSKNQLKYTSGGRHFDFHA